jgi:hypothetical protein
MAYNSFPGFTKLYCVYSNEKEYSLTRISYLEHNFANELATGNVDPKTGGKKIPFHFWVYHKETIIE